jgi:hypothetical protein
VAAVEEAVVAAQAAQVVAVIINTMRSIALVVLVMTKELLFVAQLVLKQLPFTRMAVAAVVVAQAVLEGEVKELMAQMLVVL